MAPLAPLFEFSYYTTAASLEAPLGRPAGALERSATRCDSGIGYERFTMQVRKKWRPVSIPERDLDLTQRAINALLFPIDLSLGEYAHGYVVRRSTLSNAIPHVGARYLQKFDIKDFFPSITTSAIANALVGAGFGGEAATLLARLVSCDSKLPLGARTSPRISNLMLREFDQSMGALASARSLIYTRFADDLSFSGRMPFDISADVETALRPQGFELNVAKSKSFKRGQPMFVTGLSISDDVRPRVRRRFKARLRQEFYFVQKFGVVGHGTATGDPDERRVSSGIMGRFHYARMIEPDFTDALQARYPDAYRTLIPTRADDRIERVQRYRSEFLAAVHAAPTLALPFYEPSTSLGLTATT